MQLTNSVHPPAGAIALLSVAGGEHIYAMKWKLLGSAMLVALMMLCWTILLVNLRKRYPKYWINIKLS